MLAPEVRRGKEHGTPVHPSRRQAQLLPGLGEGFMMEDQEFQASHAESCLNHQSTKHCEPHWLSAHLPTCGIQSINQHVLKANRTATSSEG